MTTEILFDIALKVSGDTPAGSAEAGYWLRLTEDQPREPEVVTRAQLATAIDAVMGITNHCTGAKTPDAFKAEGDQTAEQYAQEQLSGQGCQYFATKLNLSQNCALAKRLGNPLTKNIYAHCSVPTLRADYTLRQTGSAIILSGPSPESGIARVEIDFSNASFLSVQYYAKNEDVFDLWSQKKYEPAWIGPVLSGITKINPPTVYWINGTVIVGHEVSGKLVVYLPIQYDWYTVSIPGTLVGDRRNYNSRFIAASRYLDSPEEIILEDETGEDPQADDCSACGGDSAPFADDIGLTLDELLEAGNVEGVNISGPVAGDPDEEAPDWPTATGCCGLDEVEFFPHQESEFTGYADLPEEVKADYIKNYGADTQFIGVGPTDPPCGKLIETQEAGSCGQCDGVYDIVYDNFWSPDKVADGWQAAVYWNGGVAPYTIDLSGEGFYLSSTDDLQSKDVDVRSAVIYARDSCGKCEVTISDTCGNTDKGVILSSSGKFVVLDSDGVGNGQAVVVETHGQYRYTEDWRSATKGNCDGVADIIVRSKSEAKTTPPSLSGDKEWCGVEKYIDEEWTC